MFLETETKLTYIVHLKAFFIKLDYFMPLKYMYILSHNFLHNV